MRAVMMCAVRLMVMYADESLDVCYTDGRTLQLSPCGSELMRNKQQLSIIAHPLHTRERETQRTRFTTSDYKTLVKNALEFRNKHATRPYLPEELITLEFKKTLIDAVTEVQWPSCDSCSVECGSEGEISVCSLDGHAKLTLSSSGQEFTVEFLCRSSQTHADTHRHKNTCLLNNLSSEDSQTHHPKYTDGVKSSRNLYTRVIQQFSRASYPQSWHYPLILAIRHLESSKTGEHGMSHADVRDRDVQMSKLPDALPVKCSSPHQHRWRYERVNPDSLEQEVGITTELVKVVWCNGIIYRIIDGVTAVVEISPGDGSLIRSNEASANYFTHHKSKTAHRDTVECVYYLNGLPPDVPGQLYSVRSVVRQASRILECYIQARTSLKTTLSFSCWKEQMSACDCVNVLQEVNVVGTGCFKALSDGTAEVLFVNGVRAQMMWTPVHRNKAEVRACERWCQISLPDGQQTLVQVNTDKTYQRYVSALMEWCDWIEQTELSKIVEGGAISDSAHSNTHQPITCRSVVSELEKIKRFNFLLENSSVVRSAKRSSSCERSSDPSEIKLTENCISEALQKTSQVIQDINTLLSGKLDKQIDNNTA